MKAAATFVIAWLTMTYALSQGDVIGMVLILIGFLFIYDMCVTRKNIYKTIEYISAIYRYNNNKIFVLKS